MTPILDVGRYLTFACNMVILLTFAWLVRAYWPFARPPLPAQAIFAAMALASLILLAYDVCYVTGVFDQPTYLGASALTWRMLLALAGMYAVNWHLESRRESK